MEANMKHPKHSKPLRVAQIALALLVALAASTAAGQAGKPSAEQPKAAPVATGPSYGPVLYPQPIRSEPGAQPEQTPQAQEEKAGAAPAGRVPDPDPSARPAPPPKDPAQSQQRKDGKKASNRSARRSAPLRVDPVAAAPAAPLPQQLPPTRPVTLDPGPVQINSCLGGTCTDTNGATYNTGVGNAAVNSQGRLCTRTANTMQCF
jgi:type IV secretory pathway VirB10-like protein